MSWDSAPPSKSELQAATLGSSWDSLPPPNVSGSGLAATAVRNFAQGGTANFSDEIAGAFEGAGRAIGVDGLGGPMKDIHVNDSGPTLNWDAIKAAYESGTKKEREALRRDIENHPVLSRAADLAGAALSPVNKIAPGSSVATQGAIYGGVAGLGGSEEKSAAGMAKDAAIGTVGGAILGKAAGVIGDKIASKVSPVLQDFLEAQAGRKLNVDEIQTAAKALGVEPTPGMLSSGPEIQGLESSLSQSPTIGGYLVRKNVDKVLGAIDQVPKEVLGDATALNPYEVGESVKAGIAKKVGAKAQELGQPFEDIAESTRHIAPDPKSLARVGKNITGLDEVKLFPTRSWATTANSYAEAIQNAKSVDQLKTIRSMAGKELETAKDASDKAVLSAIYDKLTRLEENSITRGAIETMRSTARSATGKTGDAAAAEGEEIGKSMVGQLRDAKTNFAQFMNELRGVSDAASLGRTQGAKSFTSAVDNIQSEKVGDKLFNTGNRELMSKMKASFPEEAELLRKAKLADISKRSQDNLGNLTRNKFYGQLKNMGDDVAGDIFGQQNMSKLRAAKLLANELPDKIGPSGTPQGLDFHQMLNPITQGRDLLRFAAYKAMAGETAPKVAEYLMGSAEGRALAAKDPKAFKAVVLSISQSPPSSSAAAVPRAASNELDRDSSTSSQEQPVLKGKDKWASDGFDKLIEHSGNSEDLLRARENLMSDPKMKELLIKASDLNPGSKAMEALKTRIKDKLKKDGE